MSDAFAAAALRLEAVARFYKQGDNTLDVFHDLGLTLNPGEVVALVGPSGAGKSSLLHMAGLLEAPTSGEIFIAGAAASLQQFGQFVFASTAALIVGLTYDHTSRPMATTIAVSALLAFVCSRWLIRRATQSP